MDDAYPLGITDTTPLINKLRASGAQAVFPVSYLNDSLLLIRTMRQQRITIPAIGGAAGYVIPDFEKGLGEFAEDVLSIAPANYDLAPDLTERFRKRFGYFMVHEALEHAVALDVLVQAIEKAKSAKAEDVTMALRGGEIHRWLDQGDDRRRRRVRQHRPQHRCPFPVMVQWRNKELVTVWPKDVAKGAAESGNPDRN